MPARSYDFAGLPVSSRISSSMRTKLPELHTTVRLSLTETNPLLQSSMSGWTSHKGSVTLALLPGDVKTPRRVDRLRNDLVKLKRWLERAATQGQLRVCYEASGAGYMLHRALHGWAYACEVIAPSLFPKCPPCSASTIGMTPPNYLGSIGRPNSRRSGFRPRPKRRCVTSCGAATFQRERSLKSRGGGRCGSCYSPRRFRSSAESCFFVKTLPVLASLNSVRMSFFFPWHRKQTSTDSG
jgi:hypothetical protein